MYLLDVREYHRQSEGQKRRKRAGHAHTHNVDGPRTKQRVHSSLKGSGIDRFERLLYLVHIAAQDGREHRIFSYTLVGYLHSLNTRQACTDQLAKCVLKRGIAVVAELYCKANNRRFRNSDSGSEL